jgi:hypothetical protein
VLAAGRCVLSCCRVRGVKSSLKQQRNCKHDDSQGILSLAMGNEPVSYKTDQLEVSLNKDMSRHFEVVYRSVHEGEIYPYVHGTLAQSTSSVTKQDTQRE